MLDWAGLYLLNRGLESLGPKQNGEIRNKKTPEVYKASRALCFDSTAELPRF
jgi:hypothetical protein